MRRFLAAAALAITLSLPAMARDIQAIDGDTVIVGTDGPATGFRMRLEGLDTPELHGRCPEERAAALAARNRLAEIIAGGVQVETALEFDRYGRLLGRLRDKDGRDVSAVLIAEGLARPYDGGTRQPWCAEATAP